MRLIYLFIPLLCAFQFAPAHIDIDATPNNEIAREYFATDEFELSSNCPYTKFRKDSSYMYIEVLNDSIQKFHCSIFISNTAFEYQIPLHITLHENPIYDYEFDAKLIWDGFTYYIQYTIINKGTAIAPLYIMFEDKLLDVPQLFPNQEQTLITQLDFKPQNNTISFCVINCTQTQIKTELDISNQIQKPFVELGEITQNQYTQIELFSNQTPIYLNIQIQTTKDSLVYEQFISQPKTTLQYDITDTIESIQVLWQNQVVYEYEQPQKSIKKFSFPKIPLNYLLIIITGVIFSGMVLYQKRRKT